MIFLRDYIFFFHFQYYQIHFFYVSEQIITEQFISYHCIRDFSQINFFNIFMCGQYIIFNGTKIKLSNTLEQNN